ncbi:MAG: hypothetical protein U0167_05315 [bacterium]
MKNLRRILVLLALGLPLTAGTCTNTKAVDIVLGVPTEIELTINSSGGQNYHEDIDAVDLATDLDLSGKLDDAGIQASDVKTIKVVQVFYEITSAQAGKQVVNGHLDVTRGSIVGGLFTPSGGNVSVASGWTADLGTVSPDWIDITDTLDPGISTLNDIASDLLKQLKDGTPAVNTAVQYHVSGDVNPNDTETNVTWKLKIVIQVLATKDFEIPFG